MTKPNNPPAFPSPMIPEWSEGASGVTLRDYFAGQMLSAISPNWDVAATSDEDLQKMAHQIYRIADAMLAERAKGGAA